LFGGRRTFTCVWAWTGWFTFWFKYLDWPFRHRPYIARLASSYFVIAQKPASTAAASPTAPLAPLAMNAQTGARRP
ncbi:MAG TPA: hypothetical protein VL860_11325, partial [Planctomycetota bacterium]|nr:hypothetical protein [Planctomycetota bacterium]